MSFLHPLALLGLAATAIPALLHLLQRRTPPELEFPPLRYLSEAERQSARRLKLRHLLLLVLRTALVIVVVLAAARPLVPVMVGGGGAHEPTALVVILDNSPSSGAVVDGRPVLDRLKRAARGSIAGAAPGDRLWLVLADGIARTGSRDALLAAVDSAAPNARRLDLVRAVARAARVVEAEPLAAREVHVLSDLQRTALDSGEARVPKGVAVLALGRGGGAAAVNRGIASARVTEATVAVAVVGTAGAGAAPVAIRVQRRGGGGAGPVARALADVGTTVTLPLAPPLLPAGWWTGEAELEPDELRADDRRLFAWRVAPPARATVTPGGGSFVAAGLAVLRDGRRVAEGSDVVIGDGPVGGRSVVLPPADPALVGQVNRALAARGVGWRFAADGTPGAIVSELPGIAGVGVTRRYRLETGTGADGRGAGADSAVLATVNGEPWLARDGDVVLVASRLDTTWTALPASPGFVPFLDALVNRVVRGEAEVRDAEGTPRVEFALRGADTVGATVYGIDRRESDLTPADNALVARALDARVLDERAFASERFAGTRGADVSGLLLVCALLLAAVELGAATLTR